MKKAFYLAFVLSLTSHSARAVDRQPPTAQIERGRDLFSGSPKGIACGTCHSLAGIGTAVGPDLNKLAAAVGPRGIVSAIRMTVTEFVQEVRTSGKTFPGIQKQKLGDEIEIWDLSQTPPELRKLNLKQVSMKQDQEWKHPPAAAGYTSQELADIVGFLKWAATGTAKEITPADVE